MSNGNNLQIRLQKCGQCIHQYEPPHNNLCRACVAKANWWENKKASGDCDDWPQEKIDELEAECGVDNA